MYLFFKMRRSKIMKEYKKVLLKVIKEKDIHKFGRKNKFDNSFYLYYIFRILFYGEYWATFKCDECDRSTIRKKFYKWRDLGVFNEAYNILKYEYQKHRSIKYMYIDSSIIQNMNCSERINFHYKMKTKKTIKLSIICDNNYTVSSHKLSDPKIHDSKLTEILVKHVDCHFKNKPYLIGDKGYINKSTKRKLLKRKHKFKLITPLRNNQKNCVNINKKNKKLLNKRFKVESLFSILKRRYKRLQMVYDRLLKNYETFLYMALTCQFINCINKGIKFN